MKKEMIFVKCGSFVLIGVLLFSLLQQIFVSKWYYPNFAEQMARSITGFYEEEQVPVIFLGTSHVEYGISPMEIYEDYHILSYNLGTSAQPIEVSYYLLQEAIQQNSLQVAVLDVSNLFFWEMGESSWRYAMDNMPLNRNKIQMSFDYAKNFNQYSFYDGIFSLLRYHERWKTLQKIDFTDWNRNQSYYVKGYYMLATISSGITVNEMNQETEFLLNYESAFNKGFDKNQYFENTWVTELLRKI